MSSPAHTWLGLPIEDGQEKGPLVLSVLGDEAWVAIELPDVSGDPDEPVTLEDVVETTVERADADTRAFVANLIKRLAEAMAP